MATLPPWDLAVFLQKQEISSDQAHCNSTHDPTIFHVLPDMAEFDEMLLSEANKFAFFLETSDSMEWTVRQACAVESATKHSGRRVVLLVTAPHLVVCSARMRRILELPGLLVARINSSLLVSDTPLLPMFTDGRVNNSCCKTVHYSDIYRLAVLYRLDGHYKLQTVIWVI